MKYLQHSIFEEHKRINYNEKCKFCGRTLKEILCLAVSNYPMSYKQAIDSVTCLTEDEFLIKSIIE
jgi:hypothetical protein